jgi:hypothetical protein
MPSRRAIAEVLQRPCQTVDAGDDKCVTGAQKVEQHLQLGTAIAARAAGLLGTDHLAARRLERGALDRKVLIEGRYSSVPVKRHEMCRTSR